MNRDSHSTQDRAKLLVVDDQTSMTDWLDEDLRGRGFEVSVSNRPADLVKQLAQLDVDVLLTDLRMPQVTGLDLCRELSERRPDIPVLVMTAFGSLESAIDAIRAGAYDFITKPIELDLLEIALHRAVEHRRLHQQVIRLSENLSQDNAKLNLIGESQAMLDVVDQIQRAGPSDASILISGESGTGKELVANALHDVSDRKKKPFVAINCAALPEALIESELFGHAKGAFTDAKGPRKGLFQMADQGTLFLDEIGDLPQPLQAKLLRVLEQGSIRPVGSDDELDVDVRVIAATHQDLQDAVATNRFRQDLYYRLNVIELEMPPLRARGNDVLLLSQHFLRHFASKMNKSVEGVSEPAAAKLLNYDWPGNVRELRNVIERAVAMCRFDRINVDDLPDSIREFRRDEVVFGSDDPTQLVPLAELERKYIEHVVGMVGNNRSRAARILGLDRKTLYRKLKQQDDESDSLQDDGVS